ncbi:MAG: cation diffusion facilitator family transporter [Lutibacter sp.]|uniref:cation diffusion facilitator family transporter n=1 Tax=Lutibacter sp. TaxID=1925666 RepID=UPI00299F3667|nr:cation diffusion facilitator family transporter [Lutibacter sp.]MDX1828905.1 cation diffusion facilitator family transporter [Lutibacter sp.]
MSKIKTAINASYFSIIGNIILAIIKGLAGFFGHSYALIADAIESTTDIFASILVLMGLKYANKPADKNHPYGHGKAEPLITFLVVGFLITSAIIIMHEGIVNLGKQRELPKAWTLIVLGIIIVWKEISYRFVVKKSKETGSSSLKADAWHHRSDAITSVTAFIGISITLLLGEEFVNADIYAAFFAAIFILYNSYLIFRPALGEIMDENLHEDLIAEIRKVSLTVDGILDTEKCLIRKSGMKYHVDLHAIVEGKQSVKEGHYLAHKLKDKLQSEIESIEEVLIHIEPNN